MTKEDIYIRFPYLKLLDKVQLAMMSLDIVRAMLDDKEDKGNLVYSLRELIMMEVGVKCVKVE